MLIKKGNLHILFLIRSLHSVLERRIVFQNCFHKCCWCQTLSLLNTESVEQTYLTKPCFKDRQV